MRLRRRIVRETVLNDRRAFTMIELLVCVGIVALVMSLALPAVQSVRESARRTQCSNRLKQFGVAMHAFEAANGRFPKAQQIDYPPGVMPLLNEQKLASAHYRLLPYLDLGKLSDAIVLQGDIWMFPVYGPPTSAKNNEIIHRPVAVFACPSDTVPAGATSYELCGGTSPSWHITPQFAPPNSALSGFSMPATGLLASQVRDGLANTVMFSERLVGGQDPARYDPARDIVMVEIPRLGFLRPDGAADACSRVSPGLPFSPYAGMGWMFYGFGVTVYNQVLPPNSRIPDCAQGSLLSPGAFTARSLHNGGVFVCMGDGAVRFVNEQIDLTIWRAASTIAGGEAASLP